LTCSTFFFASSTLISLSLAVYCKDPLTWHHKMHFNKALTFSCTVTAVGAFSLPDFSVLRRSLPVLLARASGSGNSGSGGGGGGGGCPAIWSTITNDLTGMFLSNGQCNDDARAAIRAMFHDCGTWNKAQGDTGGCDGSLILAQEFNRDENNGLQGISAKLLALSKQRGVGVADLIVFAACKNFPIKPVQYRSHQT